jgi:hypothetical protein
MTEKHVFIYKDADGQEYKIRTACLILICHEQVVMIKDCKQEIEFPGGKVESIDRNIYDTMGRELWEELFLRGEHPGEFLADWYDVKRQIIGNPLDLHHAVWIEIMSRLVHADKRVEYFKRTGSELKTLYFIITIPKSIAAHLEKECGAYLVDIKSLQDARTMASKCLEVSKLTSSASPVLSRNIEIPVKNEYLKIRDRELFCLPKCIL